MKRFRVSHSELSFIQVARNHCTMLPAHAFFNPTFSSTVMCAHIAILPDFKPVISQRRVEMWNKFDQYHHRVPRLRMSGAM